jgi:hypothetical protein
LPRPRERWFAIAFLPNLERLDILKAINDAPADLEIAGPLF